MVYNVFIKFLILFAIITILVSYFYIFRYKSKSLANDLEIFFMKLKNKDINDKASHTLLLNLLEKNHIKTAEELNKFIEDKNQFEIELNELKKKYES